MLSFDKMNTMQKYKSARTSVCNNGKLPRIYSLVDITSTGDTIDYGCGGYFENYNLPSNVVGFDPFNKPEYDLLKRHYDTALCNNVLNVIAEREVRIEALENMRFLADVVYLYMYQGNGSGVGAVIPTRRDQYQLNRKPKEYLEEICEVFRNVEYKNELYICREE